MKDKHAPTQAQSQPAKTKRGRKPKPTGIDAILDEATRNKVLAIAASNAEAPDVTLKRFVAAAVSEEESPGKTIKVVSVGLSAAGQKTLLRLAEVRFPHVKGEVVETVAQWVLAAALRDPKTINQALGLVARYSDLEGVKQWECHARRAEAELAIWNAELAAEAEE